MAKSGSPIDPSYKFAAVTPSDTALLTYGGDPSITKGIYVGGAGNIACKNDLGATVVFTGLVVGALYPISTEQILSTSTTATNIVALF